MAPIVGWRYHCDHCHNNNGSGDDDGVDFCEHCFRYRCDTHDNTHTVTVTKEARIFGVPGRLAVLQQNSNVFSSMPVFTSSSSNNAFQWSAPYSGNSMNVDGGGGTGSVTPSFPIWEA
jgi:hypothetical protein